MAAISAARAQQADTSLLAVASAPVQQADATNPPPAAANTASTDQGLQEVIVTATKRAENIQSIPVTITAVGQATLENRNIQSFEDYALAMPQVSFTNDTPGYSQIFMRGISASTSFVGDGSNPTVAVYLDDQPITTPNGALDLHTYDINRLEVLPGPQGTLYGASSEAGTIRIITNKPDPTHFAAGYTGQIDTVYNGTLGGIAEGFVNIPITPNIAVRLVGWYERDSGFIDNVHQRITYQNGYTIDNAAFVQKHYNPVTVDGGRAMFKFNITDNWSISPTVITQKTRWDGIFGEENWKNPLNPNTGLPEGTPIPNRLSVAQFAPEPGGDSFVDYALTVAGKIGNFDLTFASAYLKRHTFSYTEYVDYTLSYEFSEPYWPSNPTMYRFESEGYNTYSNELRITSPSNYPVRFIAGLYQQRMQSDFDLYEPIPGLNPIFQVGYGTPFVWNGAEYLDFIQRVDRNWAAFAEVNWDITKSLTATVGFRRFRYDNTIQGFYGFGMANVYSPVPPPLEPNGLPVPNIPDFPYVTGQQTCFGAFRLLDQAPCTDLQQASEGWGSTPKFSLSYKFDPDHLIYATFSRGFRPGGPSRNASVPPFTPDYLTNYELGWKTSWMDHHLIFNGAFYYEQWKNFQFGYTGQYGIGLIANAGNAEVKGAEAQLQWVVTRGLNVTAAVTYNDAYITQNYCGVLVNGKPVTSNPCMVAGTAPFPPLAPEGQKLPYTPLWKMDMSVRYSWPLGASTAFVEGDQTYQSHVWPFLETAQNQAYGQEPAYGITNFSLGFDKNNWELELLIKNAFNRITPSDITSELQAAAESVATYNVLVQPRLIGLQFSQHF